MTSKNRLYLTKDGWETCSDDGVWYSDVPEHLLFLLVVAGA